MTSKFKLKKDVSKCNAADFARALREYIKRNNKKRYEIKNYIKKLALELSSRPVRAFDSSKLDKEELATATNIIASITKEGFLTTALLANMICSGKKITIILDSKNNEIFNQPLFICSDDHCYGIMVLSKPNEISLDEFHNHKHLHKLSDYERDLFWPEASTLYEYEIKDVFAFEKQTPINNPFIKEIENNPADYGNRERVVLEIFKTKHDRDALKNGINPLVAHSILHEKYSESVASGNANSTTMEAFKKLHESIVENMGSDCIEHFASGDIDEDERSEVVFSDNHFIETDLSNLPSVYLVDANTELSVKETTKIGEEPIILDDFNEEIESATKLTKTNIKKMKLDKFPSGFFKIHNEYCENKVKTSIMLRDGSRFVKYELKETTLKNEIETVEQAEMISKKHLNKYKMLCPESSGVFEIQETDDVPFEEVKIVKDVVKLTRKDNTTSNVVHFTEDYGIAYRTVEKGWYAETWLFGNKYNNVRIIQWIDFDVVEDGSRVEGVWKAKIVEPEEPPYIFSARFFANNRWIPEDSVLPPNWEVSVPDKLKWWGKNLPDSLRLQLIKATFNYFVEQNILSGSKFSLDTGSFDFILQAEKWPYVLHKVSKIGDGQIHTPNSIWQLRILTKDGGLKVFDFIANPTRTSTRSFSCALGTALSEYSGKDQLELSGEVETRDGKFKYELEEKGFLKPAIISEGYVAGDFIGKKLKGFISFEKVSEKMWTKTETK